MRHGREGSGPASHIAVSASRPFAEEVRAMSAVAVPSKPNPDPEWLVRLRALSEALETGGPLPSDPDYHPRLKLTLVRGGRDA